MYINIDLSNEFSKAGAPLRGRPERGRQLCRYIYYMSRYIYTIDILFIYPPWLSVPSGGGTTRWAPLTGSSAAGTPPGRRWPPARPRGGDPCATNNDNNIYCQFFFFDNDKIYCHIFLLNKYIFFY